MTLKDRMIAYARIVLYYIIAYVKMSKYDMYILSGSRNYDKHFTHTVLFTHKGPRKVGDERRE